MTHKHAEVLRAIADGKEVQFKSSSGNEWITANIESSVTNPFTYDYLEWRVKPKHVVRYFVQSTDIECVNLVPRIVFTQVYLEDENQFHYDLKVTYQDEVIVKSEIWGMA
jgi:hypothetical protein